MKDKRNWFILWFLIYVSFLILNLFIEESTIITVLKYGGLLSCFCYLLRYSRHDYLLIAAFLMTLISDAILVVNHTSVIGVVFFILAQFVHRFRFTRIHRSSVLPFVGSLLFIILFGFIFKLEVIYIAALMYVSLLMGNICGATKWYLKTKTKGARLTMIGFILFGICDAFVALSFATNVFYLPYLVFRIANYAAWGFYFPSQVLITLGSGKKANY